MSYRLLVSKDAHNDIDEIVGYIACVLKSPQAASDFLDNVEDGYNHVAGNPYMYALCGNERLQQQGYRKIVIKNYLILYRIDEAEKTVFIVRVVYGGRNYPELL